MFIYSHDTDSAGAKELANALDVKRVRRTNSRFRGNPDKIIVNWGNRAVTEEIAKCRIINNPDVVALVSDKLKFFQQFEGSNVRHVPFTTDSDVVKQWLQEGRTIVARKVLNGSNAEGLELFDGTQAFVTAPLWTQYVKKKDEYRIHVFNGKVIDVQRKAIRLVKPSERGGTESFRGLYYGDKHYTEECVAPIIKNQDHRVRNLANGYVFVKQDVTPPDDVLNQAKAVFDVIPLNFGAVDVIWNEKQKRAYVLEVNSAPGLEGTTVESYAKAIFDYGMEIA